MCFCFSRQTALSAALVQSGATFWLFLMPKHASSGRKLLTNEVSLET